MRGQAARRSKKMGKMKNLAASREVSNPNPVKSFAASGGEFDPKGLKGSVPFNRPVAERVEAAGISSMSMDEINAEIQAYRGK